MIFEEVKFAGLTDPVKFIIGKSQDENHAILDHAKPSDYWFHLGNDSSAHVIGVVPQGIERSKLKYIVKKGAALCKQHTAKVATRPNVAVIYTRVSNIEKCATPGEVRMLAEGNVIIC
jgi:predicted ribosome quality control (RQC) complex YloA/Tae2 family protein